MPKIIRYHKISNIKYISLHGAYLSFEWWFCNKAVSDSKDTHFISHSKNNLTESKPLNNHVSPRIDHQFKPFQPIAHRLIV